MRILGLMSGTSLDGIDAAILETDGEAVLGVGPAATFAYAETERAAIVAAIQAALALPDPTPEAIAVSTTHPPAFAPAAAAVTEAHARAVAALLAEPGAGPIDLIGFPGQTVLHRPDRRVTVQLGDAAALARQFGVPVAHDFRSADVHAGGQGAPLVPLYHAALLRRAGLAGPVAVLNLGGVANITWIGGEGTLLACDTGPGNGLLDQWMERHGLGSCDRDGATAAAGRTDAAVLERMLAHPYLRQAPPKSLDRYDFGLEPVSHLSVADGAATLAAFTAACVAAAVPLLPETPRRWIVCGGGRHNPVLMRELAVRLGADVLDADRLGWRGDALEAEAFAFLAARVVRGLPLSLPGTTGVPTPLPGGSVATP